MDNLENELAIVQIITCPDGGGAELLARNLASELKNRGYNSFIIYFSNPRKTKLYDWEFVIKSNSARSFANFFLLKKIINKLQSKYKKLILHSHLTWPFFFHQNLRYNLQLQCCFEHEQSDALRKYHP